MKNSLLLITLCCLYFVSCNSNQETESNNDKAKNTASKETGFPDLSGEIIWQQEDRTIQNISGEYPRVLFTGYYASEINKFSNSLLRQEGNKFLVSGKITKLYDLDKDGVPELILEDITSSSEGIDGTRYVLYIIENSIIVIKSAKAKMDNVGCSSFIGQNEILDIDSLAESGPYLVSTINYNYFVGEDSDCNKLQLASSKAFYTKQQGKNYLELKSTNNCVIDGNEINLGKLYAVQHNQLEKLENTTINSFEFRYNTAPKLEACGEDENMGISHLEKLAGLKLEGGQAHKRKDLMPFIEEEFMNVNPAFIKWGRKHLIPTPNQKQANGFLYQYIYEKAYKNWLRGLALQKLMLESNGIEPLLVDYANASSIIYYQEDGTKKVDYNSKFFIYLIEKYQWVDAELKKQGFENITLDGSDYGFWMRRMLDGSEPEIWETLKYILQLYDGEWYKETGITGLIQIDSVTYSTAKANSIKYNEIVKDQIPNNIVENSDGVIKVNLKNGDIKTYEDNPYEGESEASYHLMGYWAEKEIVIIGYSGYEWGNLILLDLNSGSETYPQNFYPSKGDLIVFEEQDGLEEYQMNIELRQMDGDTFRLIAEYPNRGIKDGFWKNEDFYFEQHYSQDGNPFFKIGKFGFDDILAYSPPIKNIINQPDSIPTDSATVNTN